MRFSTFKEYGALNSKPVFEAFERSLKDAGHKVVDDDMHSDVAVIWSVLWQGRMVGNKPIWDYYRKTDRNVIVLEVGGIERGKTWKVGLNGINRHSFPTKDIDEKRTEQIGLKLKNWRKDGDAILICLQHTKSLQWSQQPEINQWLHEVITNIQKYSKRPIIVRPHPRCPITSVETQFKNVYRQNPLKISNTYDNYNLEFKDIWLTINWNSNPGIQSIIDGIPAIVGPDSWAYDVAEHNFENIENPAMPERDLWLHKYASTEYTIEEIASGLPLKRLTRYL